MRLYRETNNWAWWDFIAILIIKLDDTLLPNRLLNMMIFYWETDYRTWWYFITRRIIERDETFLRDWSLNVMKFFCETNNWAWWNFLWDRTRAWWEFIARPIFENERHYCETNQRAWCDFTEVTRSYILTKESTCKHNEPLSYNFFITLFWQFYFKNSEI